MRHSLPILIVLFCFAVTAPAAEKGSTMLEKIRAGDYWYGMYQPDGEPQGYARLTLEKPEGGGLAVAWELKLAFTGGTYEEARTMRLDDDGHLAASTYTSKGEEIGSARREGDRLTGTFRKSGKEQPIDRELPDDAGCGMSFVLAPAVPREEGGEIALSELDEANGFADLGPARIVFTGKETIDLDGEKIDAAKIEMRKKSGQVLPVWVLDDGRIAKVDWGGGNLMVLSKESTEHLFQPEEPVVAAAESGPETLRLSGVLEGFTPEEVFDHFTKPELLTKFWPQEAEVEAVEGGKYVLSWPGMEWTLRGSVKEAKRGEVLAFTWKWDHTPNMPERLVTMRLSPAGDGGTKIDLTHGPYGETELEQTDRKGHLEGWIFVFGKLRELASE